MINKVTLIGSLGRDVEFKHTPNGNAVANFSIATNEKWTDKQGNKQEKTEWHNIVCWGKTAELASKYLSKGSTVYIEGKLETKSWEDQNGGGKRYMTEVNANVLKFISTNAQPKKDSMATPKNIKEAAQMVKQEFTATDIPF